MSNLSPYTVTIITKDHTQTGNNVLANAAIEIRDRLSTGASGGLSIIYEDQEGLIPITQTGATTNALGQLSFFAASGEYNAVYNNNGTLATIAIDITETKDDIINDLSQAYEFATLTVMLASAIDFKENKVISVNDADDRTTYIVRSSGDVAKGDVQLQNGLWARKESVSQYEYTAGDGGTPTAAPISFVSSKLVTEHANYAFVSQDIINMDGESQPVQSRAAFNDNQTITGVNTMNHVHSYQSFPHYSSSAILGRLSGFWSQPDVTAGQVLEVSQFKAADALGAGIIDNQTGFLCEQLTRGKFGNYAFRALGDTPSWFQGGAMFGGQPTYGKISYNADGALDIESRSGYATRFRNVGATQRSWDVNPMAGTLQHKNGAVIENQIGFTTGVTWFGANAGVAGSGARLKISDANVVFNTELIPAFDNLYAFGDASHRLSEIFSANGTINTSDERLKTFRTSIPDAEKRVAKKLKLALSSFYWNDSLEREEKDGKKARIHFGIGAQTLGAAFESEGLDPNDYAMFCFDEWESGNRYGVRMEQVLAFIIAAL